MEHIAQLVTISKYAGQRFDLVQAGGGNTSVKHNGTLYIKASGCLLSELSANYGYAILDQQKTISIIDNQHLISIKDKKEREYYAQKLLSQAKLNNEKPSIETFLHAVLPRYVLHVHAIAINLIVCKELAEKVIQELFPEALWVPYYTPGIDLGLALKSRSDRFQEKNGFAPKIIILENHGLIIASDDYSEIRPILEKTIKKAEQFTGKYFSRYKTVTELSDCYSESFGNGNIAYLSEDKLVYELLPQIKNIDFRFSPDAYVFCGKTILNLENITKKEFVEYNNKYGEPPKLVYHQGHLYVIAKDLKKAKQIEDVLKNNLIILSHLNGQSSFLTKEEINYLSTWEAEKYRQTL